MVVGVITVPKAPGLGSVVPGTPLDPSSGHWSKTQTSPSWRPGQKLQVFNLGPKSIISIFFWLHTIIHNIGWEVSSCRFNVLLLLFGLLIILMQCYSNFDNGLWFGWVTFGNENMLTNNWCKFQRVDHGGWFMALLGGSPQDRKWVSSPKLITVLC